MRVEARGGRGDGGNARGHADRHGQDVINQKRRAGHQTGADAQVLLGDNVGAAAAGVGIDSLAIRNDDDRQQADDAERYGEGEMQECCPTYNQGQQNFFGGVGARGECVRREDGQSGLLGKPLFVKLGGPKRRPEKEPLQAG